MQVRRDFFSPPVVRRGAIIAMAVVLLLSPATGSWVAAVATVLLIPTLWIFDRIGVRLLNSADATPACLFAAATVALTAIEPSLWTAGVVVGAVIIIGYAVRLDLTVVARRYRRAGRGALRHTAITTDASGWPLPVITMVLTAFPGRK